MTLTELQALSPEELRVMVAKFAGFTPCPAGGAWMKKGDVIRPLSDYHASLDSCRELRVGLTADEKASYERNLFLVVAGYAPPEHALVDYMYDVIDATPIQHCIAYILTKQALTKTKGAE